jgi:ParB-like chromosome segregation protein Spo0J
MKIETVSIDSISPDPANVRRHGEKNLEAIKSSLRRFGQQKPIVVDARHVVRAGNGTLAAARELGWKEINIVHTDLEGSEATAFSIADNRTAELAEWDDQLLRDELIALRDDDVDLAAIGFDRADMAKFEEDQPRQDLQLGDEKWLVVVTCRDEADQTDFLRQMAAAGRECRALLG